MATKIYKPELVRESPLELDEKGYQGDMPKNTNGFIKMGMEEDVVIQRISRDLYKYAASGFRELFVNEAKACRHASKKYNADPRIEVTLDPQNRKLVIEGIDSMGMTWEVFRDVYTVLGRSTNFDAEESGQFGFGRAAYTCLSEIMILEVYSRETGEKFTVMGKNGVGFQTGLPEPKMDKYGTRITLTLHKDIVYRDLWSAMRKVPVMSGVNTTLDLKSQVDGVFDDTGKRELSAKTATEIFKGRTDLEDSKIVELSDGSVDLVFAPTGECSESLGTYLVGVPIEYEYTGRFRYEIESCIVNVRDEREFMPTPDRERFSEKAAKDITEKIDAMIIEYLRKEYTTDTILGFLTSDLHHFIWNTHNNEEPIRDSLTPLVNILSSGIQTEEHRYNHPFRSIRTIRGEAKLLVMPRFMESKILAVKKHDKDITIFKPSNLEDNPVSDYTDYGVQTVDDYMKEHGLVKIKPEKIETVEEETVPVHSDYGSHRTKITEIDKHTIIAKENFSLIYNALKPSRCNYKVTKHVKGIVGGISEDKFFEKASTSTYTTTEGEKTGDSIMSSNKPVLLFGLVDKKYRSKFKSDKSITVFGDDDKQFELSALLKKNDVESVVMSYWDLCPRDNQKNYVEEYGLEFFSCLGTGELSKKIRGVYDVEFKFRVCDYINSTQDEMVRDLLIKTLTGLEFSYRGESHVFEILNEFVKVDRHVQKLKQKTKYAQSARQ